MLTADLVRPSSSKGVLRVRPLSGAKRERALAIADALLREARAHVGKTREELEEALDLDVAARERKLYLGLKKLLEDRCAFEENKGVDAAALRQDVFTAAARARELLPDDEALDRGALLDEIAPRRGLSRDELEAALFSDLKGAHRLLSVDVASAEELVDRYDLAQAQAVLLRATKVVARVGGSDPAGYRALFRKLKLLRLLFRLSLDNEGEGYRLEIDGPGALFSQGTRYGFELALALPALAALPRCSIEAEVRWGKQRLERRFLWTPEDARLPPVEEPAPRLEVTKLLEDWARLETPWRAAPADELLHLPGAEVSIPDVTFVHRETGDVVHLEVLGFWSREAVWRRVELVERGLVDRVVFAVSQRLRVSERALDEEAPAALYVYKGVMSARRIHELVESVARRP